MRFAWHGSSSHSLEAGGVRFAVDPWFSPAGTYGAWYRPNPRAPGMEAFLREFRPDYVVLTHGHFDHFDVETVRRIEAGCRPRYIASREAVAVLVETCGAAPERCLPLAPGERVALPEGWTVQAYQGDHWFTGPEGDAAARKLARHYGAMPCGGPMLQLVLEGPEGRIYISGDTTPGPIPALPGCRLAVVYMGTRMPHPTTREVSTPLPILEDAPLVLDRLRPEVLAPVHWDFHEWLEPFDLEALERLAAARTPPVRVLLPPPNTWVEV